MKDGPYLTHDLGARNDPKIVAVEMEMKGQGKAIWWDLVEMLWESGGYLPMDFKRLAYTLRYPSEDEVRSVVMDFGLFENDGERFWNESALDRIEHRNDMSVRKAEGGRKGGTARAQRRNDASSIPSSPAQADLKDSSSYASSIPSSPAQAINDMNEMNERTLSPGAQARARESRDDEEERERIFEIFFFRNFADPVGEVERFCEFYNPDGTGWKNSNGRRITNIQRTAEEWRPEKPGARFPSHFLEWYKAVYAAAKTEGDGIAGMLTDLLDVSCSGKREYTLIFANTTTRDAVADFIEANGLQRGTKLKYGTRK
ncbi:MAG: DUF4373 domain-containing protein [Bacteroidales bacterium]|nr:DUF4373 domain-containing protein [Bacteroidales bacterium]